MLPHAMPSYAAPMCCRQGNCCNLAMPDITCRCEFSVSLANQEKLLGYIAVIAVIVAIFHCFAYCELKLKLCKNTDM